MLLNLALHLALQSSLIHLIKNASVAAQAVLIILIIFSVASWTIIINKRIRLKRVQQENIAFLKLLRANDKFEAIESLEDKWTASPLAGIFRSGCQEIRQLLGMSARDELVLADPRQLTMVERSLRRAAMQEMRRLETGMGWLASTATASPFIGLFGTVVGIIVAFQGLSTQTQTSIQAVAPGIAEALVATAAGIFAAVPAYIAYNHYLGEVRQLASEMDDFVLELMNALERRTMEYGVYPS